MISELQRLATVKSVAAVLRNRHAVTNVTELPTGVYFACDELPGSHGLVLVSEAGTIVEHYFDGTAPAGSLRAWSTTYHAGFADYEQFC